MDIRPVTPELRETFLAYCVAHGAEHDDSWTTADDLLRFDESAEPAFLAYDEGEELGAASLMISGFSENGAARFRILHARDGGRTVYSALVDACTHDLPEAVERVFLFTPEGASVESSLEACGFTVERRAFVFRRPASAGPAAAPVLPGGISIRAIDPECDVAQWVRVTNAAFGGQPGRFDATAETLAGFLGESGAIDGGLIMAWHGDTAVGLARVAYDDEPGAAGVEQVAVVPEWQGRGVGRALLRTLLGIADEHGLAEAWLSTGEANARARALYASEGFVTESVRVCWARPAR